MVRMRAQPQIDYDRSVESRLLFKCSHLPSWMFIAAGTVFFACVAGQEPRSESARASPLEGRWEGASDFTTGMDIYVDTFRLDFVQKNGVLEGRFVDVEHKHVSYVPQADGSQKTPRRHQSKSCGLSR